MYLTYSIYVYTGYCRDNPDTDIYGANLYSRYLKSKKRQDAKSIGRSGL